MVVRNVSQSRTGYIVGEVVRGIAAPGWAVGRAVRAGRVVDAPVHLDTAISIRVLAAPALGRLAVGWGRGPGQVAE